MFSQTLTDSSLQQRLSAVLIQYQAVASSDPGLLRQCIPAEELWRYFCDEEKITESGWLPFEEREKGYLAALYKAFDFIFTQDKKLSLPHIKKIHEISLTNVSDSNYSTNTTNRNSRPGNLRNNHEGRSFFDLGFKPQNNYNASKDGLKEFFYQGHKYNYFNFIVMKFDYFGLKLNMDFVKLCFQLDSKSLQSDDNKLKNILYYFCVILDVRFNPLELVDLLFNDKIFLKKLFVIIEHFSKADKLQNIHTLLFNFICKESNSKNLFTFISEQPMGTTQHLRTASEHLISDFNKNMSSANLSSYAKLSQIVAFIQSIDQCHIFNDGCVRTACMNLLFALLIRNGLPIPLMENPNRFDLCSRLELIDMLITGFENTFRLIQGNYQSPADSSKIMTTLMKKDNSLYEYMQKITNDEVENRQNFKPEQIVHKNANKF